MQGRIEQFLGGCGVMPEPEPGSAELTPRSQGIGGEAYLAIVEMVARNAPLNAILDRLAGVVESHFAGSLCAVSRIRDQRISYVAGHLPEEFATAFAGVSVGLASTTCGAAAYLGRVVSASDIATDHTWAGLREIALSNGLRACWSAPATGSDGEVLGTVALYLAEPGAMPERGLTLLQAAAGLAAVAVQHHTVADTLRYQATHDPLTRLPNRYALESRLRDAVAEAGDRRFSLLYIDLDGFKLVNDTYGHTAGDEFLRQIAMRLANCIEEEDTLARMGGDEFVALLLDPADRDDPGGVAGKMLRALAHPFWASGRELFIGASIGIGLFPDDGSDSETILSHADTALSQAKAEGRNTFRSFTPRLLTGRARRLDLRNHLHRALDRGEFSLDYQPQYNLQDGRLVGKEALLRWRSSRGTIPPADFIPMAEESGLIVPIGLWTLREACRHGAALQRSSPTPVRVAVNVSIIQLAHPDFVEEVARILNQTGMPPALLELELTESALARDPVESAEKIRLLRNLGANISVDDFGTGYSSLTRLQELPLDSLKIDLSFVREIRGSGPAPPIVQAIVALARGLGINATAEGVERREQLRVLRELGCNEGQGFLLGYPEGPDARPPVLDETWFPATA